jgi:hypothetical protein
MRYRFCIPAGALALAVALAAPAGAQSVSVVVNGRDVDFVDQQPVQREGRVYIPLRGVLERMGAETIQWRPARQEVFVASGPREVRLWIGRDEARVNDDTVTLDAPPILEGGRTMVPLRFVGENLGATVRWEGATRTVHISVPQDRVAARRETLPPQGNEGVRPNTGSAERENRPRREGEAVMRVRPLRPLPNETVASFRPEIAVNVRDGNAAGVDPDAVRMWLDGEEVTRDLEIGTNSLSYRPSRDLEAGVHRVRVRVRGADGQATEREWTFRVR